MLDNIVSFVRMRTAKDSDKLIKDIAQREAESKAKAEQLDTEELELQRTLSTAREKEGAMRAKLAELEQELERLEAERRKAARAAGEQEAQEEVDDEELARVARVRNALGTKDAKDYDKDLLRVVKSYFLQWDKPVTEEQKFLNVIVPMKTDEWNGLGGKFTDPQKQAVHDLLKKIDEWDFDVFQLQEQMSGSHGHDGLAQQPEAGPCSSRRTHC